MSLIAASTVSRHLRRHLLSTVNHAGGAPTQLRIGCSVDISSTTAAATRRCLTSPSGRATLGRPGLRRPQTKGRRAPVHKSAATSATPPPASTNLPPQQPRATDPHSIANEMITNATTSEGRTPGTEAVATLTREQKLSNYAMAGGLLAFVSYVFYYSLASVGGGRSAKALLFGGDDDVGTQQNEGNASSPGFEEFLKEANEERSAQQERERAEREAKGEARELAELEGSTEARLRAAGVGEEAVVGSASEEEEREMARTAGFAEGGDEDQGGAVSKKRPLWKRVVFFWRRE